MLAELHGLRPFEGLFTLKNCVFFVDDNIISNRAYAREFLARIAESQAALVRPGLHEYRQRPGNPELCQKSGCVGLFLGFETLSRKRCAVGKRVNRPDQYVEVVQKIHDHGIGIDGSFVFGFDTDDAGVFDRTLEFVLKARLEVAYFSILTPYPGTRLHRRLTEEGRILSRGLVDLRYQHVVYRPRPLPRTSCWKATTGCSKEFIPSRSIFQAPLGHDRLEKFLLPDELWLSAER